MERASAVFADQVEDRAAKKLPAPGTRFRAPGDATYS